MQNEFFEGIFIIIAKCRQIKNITWTFKQIIKNKENRINKFKWLKLDLNCE